MSRSFDEQWDRDVEREPDYSAPRRRIPLDARGTLARQFVRHGAECGCRWCTEQPETAAALGILRRAGLL